MSQRTAEGGRGRQRDRDHLPLPAAFCRSLPLFVMGSLLCARIAAAQGTVDKQLRDNQQKLEEIRRERDRLQDDLEKIRNRVHNIASELTNLEGQKRITGRIVNELDRQIGSMRGQLDTLTVELIVTQDALAEKRAVLERRLQRGGGWRHPAVVVDGRAIGAWAIRKNGPRGQVVLETVETVTPSIRQGIAAEVSDIGHFFGLELTVSETRLRA